MSTILLYGELYLLLKLPNLNYLLIVIIAQEYMEGLEISTVHMFFEIYRRPLSKQLQWSISLVFAGPVQSGLLPIFGKTETETGPGQSQDCKRPIKTDIDRFTSVLGGSATDKNRSQPVLVKTG
jgi:hypothetical protein